MSSQSRSTWLDHNEDDASQEWREWHPSMMACDCTVLAIAPRGQGKTTFMIDATRKSEANRVMVICPTPEIYKTYADRFPILYCHGQWDEILEQQMEDILEFHDRKSMEIHVAWKRIVTEMDAEAEQMRMESFRAKMDDLTRRSVLRSWSNDKIARRVKRLEQNQREEDERLKEQREREYLRILSEMRREYSWTCIYDDLAYDKDAMNSKTVAKAVKNGRHYLQNALFACQGVRDFKCSNRDQIDWLAMSPLVTLSNVRRFMDDFIPSGFRKPAEFIEVLRTFAANKWWLVINRRADTLNPKEFVFRYRAEHQLISRRYIGSAGYIFAHQLYYDAARAERTKLKIKSRQLEIQARKDDARMEDHEDAVENSSDSVNNRKTKKVTNGRLVTAGMQKTALAGTGGRLFASLGPQTELKRVKSLSQERHPSSHSAGEDDSSDDEHPVIPKTRNQQGLPTKRVSALSGSVMPLTTSVRWNSPF